MKFVFFFLILLKNLNGIEIECPIDWFKFKSSCYKNYASAPYSTAMETCFKASQKNGAIKQPYLTNIESDEEMNFVMRFMIQNGINEIYVGANNLIKKSGDLLWERAGSTNEQSHVNSRILCPDIHVDNSSFYCGFVKNLFFDEKLSDSSFENINFTIHSIIQNQNKFCVNVSNCFTALPYLCEVNCTNQELKCVDWTEDYNNKLRSNTIFSTKSTRILANITRFDPCASKENKCENNSTCILDEYAIEKYSCICQEGFEGIYCQRDERPCQPHRNKCKHNSTCVQSGRSYNCTCLSGFEGSHCEKNIDDCEEGVCKNGAQCQDLVNTFRCECLSYFYGNFCEFKREDLVLKENVSRSFSVFAIISIVLTYGFFITLDLLRFFFKIEPSGLLEERQLIRKKRLMKKIMEDMKSKRKRKKYHKIIYANFTGKDPFIAKFEKTFRISYDLDLPFIDEEPQKSSNLV
ncbi:unnamed protein product [Brachionus calyciflorus]|uniref:EGF-like domain-containing protein n=1 Tax=Brachionus calyciflorus TaxID=104777 RepID=A0A813P3L5_9BILA|nr:unnamed protein product [Brachionus calyciflorus]